MIDKQKMVADSASLTWAPLAESSSVPPCHQKDSRMACRLTGPTHMYEHIVPWPGEPAPRCLGDGRVIPAWVPAEVVERSSRDPSRALVQARYASKEYWCWLREHIQFEAL